MIVKALKVSDNDMVNNSDGDNSIIVIVVLITCTPLHFQNSQQSNQD